jgi:predicted RNase H-like HicB family nuclease
MIHIYLLESRVALYDTPNLIEGKGAVPDKSGSVIVYSRDLVINEYITVALRRAHYELLEGGEGFYASIPELAGVWAQAATLEECRDGLKSALEDWLLFSLSRQLPIPAMDGVDLVIREVA